MSQGVYVLGGKCPGGKCPGGKCPGGICPWGKCPGGTCPGRLCPRTMKGDRFVKSQLWKRFKPVISVKKISRKNTIFSFIWLNFFK